MFLLFHPLLIRFGGKVMNSKPNDKIISEKSFLKSVNGPKLGFSGLKKYPCNICLCTRA